MKKGHIKLLIFSLFTILLLLINSIFSMMNIYTYVLFLAVILVVFYAMFGFWKVKSIHQENAMLMIVSAALIFYFVTYLGGIFVGFSRNGYDLSFLGIVKNILPLILIIIGEEVLRFNLIKHSFKYKELFLLIIIMFSLMEMTLIFGNYAINSTSKILEFIIVYFIPIVISNIFLTYLSHNIDYKPAILYRILFSLNIYLFPIIPDFGIYVGSLIKVFLPMILMYVVYKKFYDKKDKIVLLDNKFSKLMFLIVLFLVLSIVSLVTGWFKYRALTIGSGSMVPKINVGDVVIVETLTNKQKSEIQEGDILVFHFNQRIIVHRVNKVIKNKEMILFETKGDANKSVDNELVEEENVIGIAKVRIPYLGYPTIRLNEIISK